jgi:hypothetical protein
VLPSEGEVGVCWRGRVLPSEGEAGVRWRGRVLPSEGEAGVRWRRRVLAPGASLRQRRAHHRRRRRPRGTRSATSTRRPDLARPARPSPRPRRAPPSRPRSPPPAAPRGDAHQHRPPRPRRSPRPPRRPPRPARPPPGRAPRSTAITSPGERVGREVHPRVARRGHRPSRDQQHRVVAAPALRRRVRPRVGHRAVEEQPRPELSQHVVVRDLVSPPRAPAGPSTGTSPAPRARLSFVGVQHLLRRLRRASPAGRRPGCTRRPRAAPSTHIPSPARYGNSSVSRSARGASRIRTWSTTRNCARDHRGHVRACLAPGAAQRAPGMKSSIAAVASPSMTAIAAVCASPRPRTWWV